MTTELKIIRVVTHQSGPHRYRMATVEEAVANLREATALYLAEFPLKKNLHPLVTSFEVPVHA